MIKKIGLMILVFILLLTTVGCGRDNFVKEKITDVNISKVKKDELGQGMPEILFANDGKICFWGSFGLYVVYGETGEIYRAVDLEEIGYNSMGGEFITQFEVGTDYNSVYFMNVDSEGENLDNYFWYYNIEEDIVRQLPVGTGVEILAKAPPMTLDFAADGEPEKGYASNVIIYTTDSTVYLHADDNWKVKSLKLVFFDFNTKSTTEVKLFQ